MVRLGVILDQVATLRQARRGAEPDPVQAAVLAELGGADGLLCHLRADRRHIGDRDLEVLRQVVKSRLTLMMAATQEMTRIALTVKPDEVRLVAERREEIALEGALDVVLNSVQLRPVVRNLQEGGMRVSLFVEANPDQVKEAHKLDVQAVQVNTAPYADARDERMRELALRSLVDAARLGRKLGLEVHAGHGLDYGNVAAICSVSEIAEISVGHAVVSRAVLVGMERAVREMREAMRGR